MGMETEVLTDPAVIGRRILECPRTHLSQNEERMCELSDSGFSPDVVAARCRVDVGKVDRVLGSEGGRKYLDYLSAQRDMDVEYMAKAWSELSVKATSRLSEVVEKGSDSAAISAIREVFDRHPDRRFVKVTREERTVSNVGRIDVAAENKRVKQVLNSVGLLT